jgi:cell pole-organizing protein PopZ
MEEILASIRRIIADDNPDAAKAAAASAPPPAPQPKPASVPAPAAPPKAAMNQDDIDAMLADQVADESDVLELGDPVSPPRAAASESGFRQVPASDVLFREEPEREAPPPVSYAEPAPPMERLLSAETNAAVSAAFGSLATTILSENSRTIEDLVREMLRPMLKAWLDDNLPGLVERMVRAEIERVSRGGR